MSSSSFTVLAKGFMAKEDLWTKEEVDPSTFDLEFERGSDEWRLQCIQKAYCNEENYRRRDLAIQLAKKSNLKLAQIAMLYPLTKGKHISVIFGSSKPHHIDDMVALQHFHIDQTAMTRFTNPKAGKKSLFPWKPQFVMENGQNNVKPMVSPKSESKEFAFIKNDSP